MIKVKFFKNGNGDIYCFEVLDHGESIVCAGVSALTFNTINSIDKFTSCNFSTEIIEDDGRIVFMCQSLKNGKKDDKVTLLLNSFELGLQGILEEYGKDIELKYEEV